MITDNIKDYNHNIAHSNDAQGDFGVNTPCAELRAVCDCGGIFVPNVSRSKRFWTFSIPFEGQDSSTQLRQNQIPDKY